MEIDTFLASPRWEILEIISENPASPIEISQKLKATVSYISQQLKLLEAAGIVTKKRTGAVERGKPRTIFSISKELMHVTSLTRDFSAKKLLILSDYQKVILRIWLIENTSFHYPLEKFFWKIEQHLKEIDGIFVDISKLNLKVIILAEDKKIESKIEAAIRQIEEKIDYDLISENNLGKFELGNLIVIYDPKLIFKKLKQMKGGEKR